MFSKSLLALAATALLSVATAASPPGCVLGVVNSYDKPDDIKAVCSAKDITSKVSKACGDAAKDALASLADVCNGVNVKISTTPSASGSAAPSGTGASKTGVPSNSQASGTPVAGGPGSAASGPAAGGAASALDISAAALLAGFGMVVISL